MTATVEQQQPGTELTVIERASLALGAAEHEKVLLELAKQSTEIVAITNAAGLQQCRSARIALKNARIDIEKHGKTARDDATKFSKAVIAEEHRLIGIIQPEELRLQKIQDEHDAQVAAKKAAAERAEAERVARIQAGIRDIRNSLIDVAGRSAGAIEEKIRELVGHDLSPASCQEFVGDAETARTETLAKLRDMHAAALAQEAETARIRAERKELGRRQAEQDARETAERERVAAENRQREEAATAERARIAAEEQAARDRIATQEREARERHEAEERRQQAERDRITSEARALEDRQRQEREAVEARERVERQAEESRERQERLAREAEEREQREAQEKADREERERVAAETQAREAEERRALEEADARKREEQRKANEILDGREMAVTFKARFGVHAEFAGIVKAIDLYLAPRSKSQAKRIAAQTS